MLFFIYPRLLLQNVGRLIYIPFKIETIWAEICQCTRLYSHKDSGGMLGRGVRPFYLQLYEK